MAENSAIEWTDTTWNPVTGCTKISAGCDNCYAARFSERFRGVPGHPFQTGFDLTLRPERLSQPLGWKRPRMVFVNSMSDLFHREIPPAHIAAVFDTMERADWHTYQVLTKRSSLLQKFVNARYRTRPAPRHIWLGVSVEDKKATSRIAHLKAANAGVRFLSIEPLLAPVGKLELTDIDWVIVGGESGPGARPMDARWVIDIRNQCVKGRVVFFFKQWSGFSPKAGGRLLEGKEWIRAISAAVFRPESAALLALPDTEELVVPHHGLDAADLAAIGDARTPETRLSYALQLCALRYPGRHLRRGELLPPIMLDHIAEQIGVDAGVIAHSPAVLRPATTSSRQSSAGSATATSPARSRRS